MMKQRFIIYIFVLSLFLPLSYVNAGIILIPHKYAWSNNVGYINFENVIVGDSALSGTAWSTNKGLIKFNPALGGVLNDGAGNLSGSAWGEQLGWIDFGNVKINGTTGEFSGTATGALVGTITFDCHYCDVRTDWRPAASLPTPAPSGGGSRMILPNTVSAPVNETTPVVPGIPNTGLSTAENSPPSAPVAVNNGGAPAPTEAAAPVPLFDVVTEPVGATPPGSFPLVFFPIIAGTLLALFALKFFFFPTTLKIAYYNATGTAGVSGIVEKTIRKQFSHFQTVSLSNASKTNYQGNLVIDLSGRHSREAAKIAKLIRGVVAPMPIGEVLPKADILVITGQ